MFVKLERNIKCLMMGVHWHDSPRVGGRIGKLTMKWKGELMNMKVLAIRIIVSSYNA